MAEERTSKLTKSDLEPPLADCGSRRGETVRMAFSFNGGGSSSSIASAQYRAERRNGYDYAEHSSVNMAHNLNPIREALLCLLDFQIAVRLKRLLVEVASDPPQTFWNYVAGIQTDRAVIEWCKVLGDRNQHTHWHGLVQDSDQAEVLAAVLGATGLAQPDWEEYWRSMMDFRNKRAAHADTDAPFFVTHYPKFDPALAASTVVFDKLYDLLPEDQRGGLSSSLDRWAGSIVSNMRPVVISAFDGSKVLGTNVPKH